MTRREALAAMGAAVVGAVVPLPAVTTEALVYIRFHSYPGVDFTEIDL